jgi:hypothetical protein
MRVRRGSQTFSTFRHLANRANKQSRAKELTQESVFVGRSSVQTSSNVVSRWIKRVELRVGIHFLSVGLNRFELAGLATELTR